MQLNSIVCALETRLRFTQAMVETHCKEGDLLLSVKVKTFVVLLLTISRRNVFFLLILRRNASNGRQAE